MDVRELSDDDCRLAHAAMRELRPQVGDEPAFVERVRSQFAQGYRLIGAFDGEHEHAVSVAGFRIDEKLAWGRHVYIDDLSTLPEGRGRGGATALLRWIDALAAAEGIVEVHLVARQPFALNLQFLGLELDEFLAQFLPGEGVAPEGLLVEAVVG